MAVVITSTTSSQKDMDHAASENWRTKPEPEPVDQEVTEVAEVEQPEAAAASEPAEQQESEQPKRKGGYQKKIDKLTARVRDLENELETERTRGKAPAETAERPQPAVAAGDKPKQENFKTHDEYVEALVDWTTQQRLAKMEADETAKAEAERAKAVFDAYNQRMAEAKAEHDDFDKVVGRPDIQIPQSVQLAVFEMENGPEVAYFLGQNPEVCAQLCELSPLAAVMQVTKIAAKLDKNAPSPEQKQRPTPPPPIRTVGGGASQSTVPLDKLPIKEYNRIMDERETQRKRAGRY